VRQLTWLDRPSEEAFARAEELLVRLNALDGETGGLTEVGKRLLSLSAPPRLARILVEAQRRGCEYEASLLAALASVGPAFGIETGARVAVPVPGAADAGAGLEQSHPKPEFAQPVELVEAGDAGADDDSVEIHDHLS
jgi:HrpA-like RNA helicase